MLAKIFSQKERQGSVSVMFAAAAIPMVGLVGLAVDYGIWNQTNAELSVAANVAAMTAVKVAANAQLAADPTAQAQGNAAALQWFASEIGSDFNHVGTTPLILTNNAPTVTVVTTGTTVSAQVSYAGTVASVFGNILFFIPKYFIGGSATASVSFAPYLTVEMLLDNSSSMDIGATPSDMNTLQQISACDPNNAVYTTNPKGNASYDPYNSYQYSGNKQYSLYVNSNGSFKGVNPAPVKLTLTGVTATAGNVGPSCKGYLPQYYDPGTKSMVYPTAGPPCEFACHWDASANSGQAADLYGAARRTLGTANPVTLRFDEVKNATNQILQTMQNDDLAIRNLNVGIFTFNTALTRVYPGSGEGGDDWGTAIADVGLPPTSPTQSETGIVPGIGFRQGVNPPGNDDTDIVDSMKTLLTSANLTSSSGNGTTAALPRRVLFLITDGYMDDNTRGRTAFPTNLCDGLKALNYTIYVVFTPYYPIMHDVYVNAGYGDVINSPPNVYTDPGTLAYGLAQCASSPADIISAQSQSDLNLALQKFLLAALTAPAKFTQ